MSIVISYLLIGLAAIVSLLNWGCVFSNIRLRTSGVKKTVSTVPLVAQILLCLAALLSREAIFPYWAFVVIGLLDPALYSVLYLPIFLLKRKFNGST